MKNYEYKHYQQKDFFIINFKKIRILGIFGFLKRAGMILVGVIPALHRYGQKIDLQNQIIQALHFFAERKRFFVFD